MHRSLTTLLAAGLLLAAPAARAGFTETAMSSGVFGDGPTWGAQAADIDGDGDPDLMLGHHDAPNVIYTNDGAGVFSSSGIAQLVADIQDRHGPLWADLDNDGVLDLLIAHGGGGGCGCPSGGNELFRGLGGGTFALVDSAGGMFDGPGRVRAFSAADIDGDGDLDLHAGKAPLAQSLNSLYRNDGDMTFVDVAADLGLDEEDGTVGSLFADVDDDGDPDLFVGGEEFARPSILWRNDGGMFTDATADLFGSLPIAAGADFGDYDNDGDVDLALCEGDDAIYDAWGVDGNDFWFFAHHRFAEDGVDVFQVDTPGGSPVAQIEWQGTFTANRVFLGPSGVHPGSPVFVLTDAYVGAPTFTPGVDEGVYVWRETAGGTWQIHVSAPAATVGNYSGILFTAGGVTNPASSNLEQLTIPAVTPRVYRNDGGSFAEVTTELGFTASGNPRGLSWVDFDNDGDLDLSLFNKGTAETRGEANVLWRNDGAAFTALAGAGWPGGDTAHLTDGGVWADLDRDGGLDLLLQHGAGPTFFHDLAVPELWHNDGPFGHWLSVSLGRTLTGGTAVGAAVTAHAGSLSVHRRLEANAWRGFQHARELHFGLGDAAVVDSLVIAWPDGSTGVLTALAADQFLFVDDFDPAVDAPLPAGLWPRVGRVFPQPSLGVQRLEIALEEPARLRVRVHDVRGRVVRTLLEGDRSGTVTVSWDGRDAAGRPVAAGVYFLRGDGDVPFLRKAIRLR